MAKANICCSIELEPKTLSQGQLNHAREAAADVVQKMKSNEASITFVEGLEPANVEKDEQILQKGEQLPNLELVQCNSGNDQNKSQIIESPCQCSVATHVESPDDQVNLKEPLSAPF